MERCRVQERPLCMQYLHINWNHEREIAWQSTQKKRAALWQIIQHVNTARIVNIHLALLSSSNAQITTPAPHHSVFYRPDALPAAQPTASKRWRRQINTKQIMDIRFRPRSGAASGESVWVFAYFAPHALPGHYVHKWPRPQNGMSHNRSQCGQSVIELQPLVSCADNFVKFRCVVSCTETYIKTGTLIWSKKWNLPNYI